MRWIALALVLTCFGAARAEAHAHLLSAVPGAGAVLTRAPARLDLHYSEGLEPHFSSVAVTDAAGNRVDDGSLALDPNDPRHVIVALKPLAAGSYHVAWHATSVDTHRTAGAFDFSVAGAAPSALEVGGAWARPTPGASTEGAVYLTILNHGSTADRLLGAAAASVAGSAELHENAAGAGTMTTMQPLATAIVPARGSFAFQPLGRHIMLVGLKGRLVLGQTFPLVLQFEKAGAVTVMVTVARDAPALQAMPGMKM